MKRRVAHLPLHSGKAPPWLFKRMTKLAGAVTMAIVEEFGPAEMLRRLSDPWWFQAFGCVLGFAIYHHSFFFTPARQWCVVQQGMDEECGWARRYHWLGESVEDFVCEPHAAVQDLSELPVESTPSMAGSGQRQLTLLNMVAEEAGENRRASTALVREPSGWLMDEIERLTEGPTLFAPARHPVLDLDVDRNRLNRILTSAHERNPQDFETLLGLQGIGPATVRSLALLAEIIFQAPPSRRDPDGEQVCRRRCQPGRYPRCRRRAPLGRLFLHPRWQGRHALPRGTGHLRPQRRGFDRRGAEGSAWPERQVRGPSTPISVGRAFGSYAFYDYGAIVGASKTMLADLAIRRAVVPRLCLIEGGKLQDDDAFHVRAFEHLVTAVRGQYCDRLTGQGVADLLRVGLKLRWVAGAFADEDGIRWHFGLQFVFKLDL